MQVTGLLTTAGASRFPLAFDLNLIYFSNPMHSAFRLNYFPSLLKLQRKKQVLKKLRIFPGSLGASKPQAAMPRVHCESLAVDEPAWTPGDS